MNIILSGKKLIKNKFFDTFLFAALLIYGVIKIIKYNITYFEEFIFDFEFVLFELLCIGVFLFLLYLFLDSYMRNFGLKAKADKAYKLGDYDLAIKQYSTLLKIFRWNGHYYCDRGNCYYKLKNWNLAVNDYTKAIKLEPEAAYIYENRANAYKFMGFKTHAKKDYNTFKKLNK